jgi:nucleotide-binding universal stress UspA family protein
VSLNPLSDYLAREARCADLLVTSVDRNNSVFDASRHVEMGDLVMRIGRPVLVVPKSTAKLTLERILIGWKDTRETRRAVVDALPLLKKANFVGVAEIAIESEMVEARQHLGDVVEWLKRHGVAANAIASPSTRDDSRRLGELAQEQKADLIVAGAYGHNRVREWMLGGVTRDLLLRPDRCSLVSH